MKKPQRKKYRSFNSVEDLLKAQKQIKKEYRDLENNALNNIFDPVQIGLNILPTALSFFRGSKTERQQRKAMRKVEKQSEQAVNKINTLVENTNSAINIPTKKKGLNIVDLSKNESFGKKIFASFIRWQLIELGIWGIRKIIKHNKK